MSRRSAPSCSGLAASSKLYTTASPPHRLSPPRLIASSPIPLSRAPPRPLNTHFVLLPQMRLVAFHLEQKQKSFSRFLIIFVARHERILVPKKISTISSEAIYRHIVPIYHLQGLAASSKLYTTASPPTALSPRAQLPKGQ